MKEEVVLQRNLQKLEVVLALAKSIAALAARPHAWRWGSCGAGFDKALTLLPMK